MRAPWTLFISALAVGSAAYFTPFEVLPPAPVSLRIVDAETGRSVPGVVRIRMQGADGVGVEPEGLVSRGWGLKPDAEIGDWFAVPGPTRLELPRGRLRLDALSGIETHAASVVLDLTAGDPAEVVVPIERFSDLAGQGWYSANTHLHLRSLSRQESDRYLREIPSVDRLDLLFISYLERAGDDRDYITNEYPIGSLADPVIPGVLLANGEEHRHNFGPQGEGFGHVMLLGIRELVRPVSVGYGISKKHPDAPPIRAGIDNAHGQGGTAIWCHNNWGYEDVPNWLAGRLDAQNIFDGGSHGGYAESFYHYLNAGLRVPFSTGTDWFMYDFARVYARVDGPLSAESWLKGLKGGRSFITNGPLLSLRVEDSECGDTVALDQPGPLKVRLAARGRLDFGRLELVGNGKVMESSPCRKVDGHYEASIVMERMVSEPVWLAGRVTAQGKSEYGYPLFAHTSPVYVTLGGRSVQIEQDIRFLLGEVQSARSTIAAQARFDNEAQRDSILSMYDQAVEQLRKQLQP